MAIYKTRNTGRGNRMRGMREMFTRIPGNLLEDSWECYYFNIRGDVEEDSRECSRTFRGTLVQIPRSIHSGECSRRFRECSKRFQGMFKKTPGNVQEDSGKCSKRFRGMFEKIPGHVQEDSGECTKRLRGKLVKINVDCFG